jgi:hypothetical protein
MSKMVWCEEGHKYDMEMRPYCPQCGKASSPTRNKAEATRLQGRASDAGGGDAPPPRETLGFEYGAQGHPPEPAQQDEDDGGPETHGEFLPRSPTGPGPSPCQPAFQPVVGWLVCIVGCEMGRDYRLRAGNNLVGRDLSSQVCIACDLKVSRRDHARVFHDLETSDTYLVPGTGQNGVYLNKAIALQSVRLKAHDIISLGNTKLMFIPFCGEHFKWNGQSREPVAAAPSRQGAAQDASHVSGRGQTEFGDSPSSPPESNGLF